ncbi:binding--dependent transport system inner membrane component family protein [Anoxybacillus sp. B7M1]|jgi:D-methionine transport system permease protein|uniref:ABC transporter permease n=1 Tax=Anoxybacteroides rupiense TaxID=311460 RepID=A0ABD5IZJ6_9BACL|nr:MULTISPECIES: methionine ABC transporter permease [Anoxybacillus]ANB57956.1 binding--dependent transport system inner membrane component family protein [Anoxybacillus sp. B2M1]ANB64108.1 binding--dependent transport system inner membrane component family protein [Anoxybacillus sp. B7M1]KXG08692.1 D-methionine transport system permease protein MetI [Anoxybacillus sp. P3H1B]MBS2770842.1 ABC transporter permease [Anoxybacillus rupiensis]MDE8563648.1 ABC transporter permease [Anoxybacillus rupi
MLLNALIDLIPELNKAFLETIYMVAISLCIAILIGLPLGILLFVTDRGLFLENNIVKSVLGFAVNLIRSIPFVILLVGLLPLTRLITGTTIGPTAASVSLSVAAIPFFARMVETSLREIEKGVIEAAIAVGATPWMIIKDVLLSEARPGIVHGITITTISLVGYSAMAGIVGGGGIGDLAIRFGYYRYDNTVMITTIVVLICLVQIIQFSGERIARLVDKR